LPNYSHNKKPLGKLVRWLLIFTGTLALGLGTVGVIVPLIPTTPFLLLTAACYIRSSERLYDWLMDHKLYGKFLHNYMEHKAISLNVKIGTIVMLWLTIIISSLFLINLVWLKLLFIIKAILVTLHIVSFKTIR
jgi:uncharacterized protein